MERVRRAQQSDVGAVCELYAEVYRREIEDDPTEVIADLPCVVDYEGELLVGFCLCGRFGPDIATLTTIAVREAWRSKGVGSGMLCVLEGILADDGWAGLVLVNSMGYPGKEGGRLAGNFYRRQGYTLAIDTGLSLVFAKRLG